MQTFADYSIPSIKEPFGMSDSQKTFVSNFNSALATPKSNGGTQITRHQMNGVGYLATLGVFLDQAGYPWGNVDGVPDGGYPQGAIITKTFIKNNRLYVGEFFNRMEANQTAPFNSTDVIDDVDVESNGWTPLYRTEQYNFFPNYANRILLETRRLSDSTTFTIEHEGQGWLLVQRTLDNWDTISWGNKLTKEATLYLAAASQYDYMSSDSMEIHAYEGAEASRLIPFQDSLTIRCLFDSATFRSMTISAYLYPLEEE